MKTLLVLTCFITWPMFLAAMELLEANSGSYRWEKPTEGIVQRVTAGAHLLFRERASGELEELDFPTKSFLCVLPRMLSFSIQDGILMLDFDISGIPFRYSFDGKDWVCISDGLREKYVSPTPGIVDEFVWFYSLLEARENHSSSKYERPFWVTFRSSDSNITSKKIFEIERDIAARMESLKTQSNSFGRIENPASNPQKDLVAASKNDFPWLGFACGAGALFVLGGGLFLWRRRKRSRA